MDRISDAYIRMGEGAYGVYNTTLFRPIQRALREEGLICRPALPGTLAHSFEPETPADHRIRHMWTFLWESSGGPALGALITSFPHDHTQLRLPGAPSVVALAETTDRGVLASVLESIHIDDPEEIDPT